MSVASAVLAIDEARQSPRSNKLRRTSSALGFGRMHPSTLSVYNSRAGAVKKGEVVAGRSSPKISFIVLLPTSKLLPTPE